AHPLELLESAATAVAGGDLTTRSGLSARSDELGSLGRSFDAMAADLEQGEAARRRFFADAAHEMKTPLSVIDATAAAVLDGVYPYDHRHLETIRAQARLLARIVDDLRTISLAEAGALPLAKAPVALDDVARAIVSAFEARALVRAITLGVAPGPGRIVRADRDRLTQAVATMVDNAIRHAPAGGHVTMRFGPSPAAPGRARLEVADDGPGIADTDLAHLFDRFYQADVARDRASGTSGLGLAIARAIAEAHGGSVGAANRPEGGARFWIDIPE
ncbi:MAG: ATP-binding protein, partial [Chloroflexota bacterium]